MAEQATQVEETTEDNVEDTEPRSGGLMRTVRVAAFLIAVIGVECAVAIMIVPSAEETAEAAKSMFEGDSGIKLPEEDEGVEEKEVEDTDEVMFGEFHVSVFRPESQTTIRIDFELYGTVLAENVIDFEERLAENEHRLREQVIVTFRAIDMTDLADAGLGLIKRKILETTNRTLGKAIVKEVIFSDFSFVEQ